MTRQRAYGDDTPFGAWIRSVPELGSAIHQAAFTINDADWILHKYTTHGDGLGLREVQHVMFLEVKTNNAESSKHQLDTLWTIDRVFHYRQKVTFPGENKPRSVWAHGVHILRLTGLRPDDGLPIKWGSLTQNGVVYRDIENDQELISILRFDIDPEDGLKLSLRRHHKTQLLEREVIWPIGFRVTEIITQRS